MDLSIIIPAYNAEKYIEKCVNSVLKQKTNYDFEVIVVDDGSSDMTLEIVSALTSDSRLVIYTQKNKGVSAARNIGLDIAGGRYILFLDADDRLAAGCIQDMLNTAYKTGSDIVQCGYVFENAGHIRKSKYKPKNHEYSTYKEMCDNVPGYATMKLIRYELFDGIRFPEGFRYEDSIIHLRVFQRCKKLTVIDKLYYIYTRNPDSFTHSKEDILKRLQTVYVLEDIVKDMTKEEIAAAYDEILIHMGKISFHRIKVLKRKYKKIAFKHMCDLISKLNLHTRNRKLKKIERILYKRNFLKYMLMGVIK